MKVSGVRGKFLPPPVAKGGRGGFGGALRTDTLPRDIELIPEIGFWTGMILHINRIPGDTVKNFCSGYSRTAMEGGTLKIQQWCVNFRHR